MTSLKKNSINVSVTDIFSNEIELDLHASVSHRYDITYNEIVEFITKFGYKVEKPSQKFSTKNMIFISERNFAISIESLYNESYNPISMVTEDKDLHFIQTKLFKEEGIKLIHVTDYEWNKKKSIIKSIIQNHLGHSKIIFARKTRLKEYKYGWMKDFFNFNHLQGMLPGEKYLGLEYDGELVMAMIFGKPRFFNDRIEVLRMVTKMNHSIVGGLSKITKHSGYNKLLSYCALSKFDGRGYGKSGFTFRKDTVPGYFWTDGLEIVSRQRCQHKNLRKWLKTYDSEKTEIQNMFGAGYRRYFDCGNGIWDWN